MLTTETFRQNVDLIRLDDREIYLIGTAHVSRSSLELAEEIINLIKPDSVAIELCASRYESLRDPDRWKKMDITAVIKQGKIYLLLAQLMLAGFQKKLGKQLDIKPGAEMLHAAAIAEKVGAEVVLADREIRTTLKRTWASLGFWAMLKLMGSMVVGLFGHQKIDEKEIERLKSSDALQELMKEFSQKLPGVRVALIDERDLYLAAKIRAAPGRKIVAVVGAGHVPGILGAIDKIIDLAPLEIIPSKRLSSRVISWSIPLAILVLFAWAISNADFSQGVEMVKVWFWLNGLCASLGAALALAHPLAILAAFVSAPFTAFTPFFRAGIIAGFVEAMLRKPVVSDFESIGDDIVSIRGVWRNRASRIILVILLTNIFARLGLLLGGIGVAALI